MKIWEILFIGIFATISIDVWALILNKVFKLPITNWGMVGRWVGHIPQGKFTNSSIKDVVEIKNEHAIGWLLHYVIGFIFAYFYIFIAAEHKPSLTSAVVFGWLTVVFPWFVLQPGLGLGMFARFAAKPNVVRLINLSIHTVFGASLYFGGIFLSLIGSKQ